MNALCRLPENAHEHGIGGVGPRQLHVVSQLVRRHTLEH